MDLTSHSASPKFLAPSSLSGKRVAMVTFSPYPGDPRPRRAINVLLSEGMAVDLICVGYGDAPTRESSKGMRILRFPVRHRRGGKLLYVWNYCAFILFSAIVLAMRTIKCRYDLVYIHNMPDILVLSSLVPKALGARVLLDLHDPMPELMRTIFNLDADCLSVRLVRWLEKWSIARAHSVLTVNVACKRIFASRSCPAGKIGVVMNSPDEEIIPFRRPRSYSSASDVPDKHFVIMYHGSSVERNGLALAVDALAQVRKKVPSAELRIYGRNTRFLSGILNKARDNGLEGSVRYLGMKRLEDLVREIESCDLGVVPNLQNAFTEINMPTRIFEYLAMGKPVIAPRTPGIQDYFGPESLLFFDSGSVEDLARGIEYAASHYEEAINIAERGQTVYLTHTWSREGQILVDVMDKLLSNGQPRLASVVGGHPERVGYGDPRPNDQYS